jgi:hypothetical protein
VCSIAHVTHRGVGHDLSPVTLKAVRRCVQSKLEIAQSQIVHKGREYPILQELVIYQAIAGFLLAIMLAKINISKYLINNWRGEKCFAVLIACNRAPNYQINFSAN